MRQKFKFKFLLWSLIWILGITTLASCSDEDIWYPDTMSYETFNIDNAKGHFLYDEAEKEWHFIFDNSNEVLGKSFMCTDSPEVIVANMKDTFKSLKDDVIINGKANFMYVKSQTVGNQTFQSYYYKLEIENAQIIDNAKAKTRSIDDDALPCGTIGTTAPAWLFSRSSYQTPIYGQADFRVFVHIVRSSSGIGYSNSIATPLIEKLNSYYNIHNISFSLIGTDYIDSDKYNLMTKKEAENHGSGLYSINTCSNAINLYVISDGTNLGGLLGVADDIPGTAAIINSADYAKFTVAHEVGHCLGLYHTHHGTAERGSLPELVNGSNAILAGDYIADTPADPNIWSGGLYAGGNKTDANGDKYNPDPRNIMSYSFNRYQNLFTPGQVSYISQSINYSQNLKNTGTFSKFSISGPDFIEGEGKYTLNATTGCSSTWNVTLETFTSKNSSPTSIVLSSGNGTTYLLSNPNQEAISQRYTITVTKRNTYGAEAKYTKTVYHIKPSAKTGTLTWGTSANNAPGYNGTLDLEKGASYNKIKVYQGGSISFIYKDVCGAESYNDSYFNFNLNDRHFTKGQANHIFTCESYTTAGSYTTQLVLYVGNTIKVIPIMIEVMQVPNTPLTPYEEQENQKETDLDN